MCFDFGCVGGNLAGGGLGPLDPAALLYTAYLVQRFGPQGVEFVRRTANALQRKPSLTTQQISSIRSITQNILTEISKLTKFAKNPTVRPGMEGLPQSVIRQQQQVRVQHLQTEIRTAQDNIIKILNGEL